jgi:hypothetical protein
MRETEGVVMCFDALTVAGLLLAVLSGGFLVGLVSHNDRSSAKADAESNGHSASATMSPTDS